MSTRNKSKVFYRATAPTEVVHKGHYRKAHFSVGEAARMLEAPYRTTWASGFICEYAAAQLEVWVLLVGALAEIVPVGRLQLILKSLDTVIEFSRRMPSTRLEPYLHMRRIPTLEEIIYFRDHFPSLTVDDLLYLRIRFSRDEQACRLLTFGPREYDSLAANYELIVHEGKRDFGLRKPLLLAYEVATSNGWSLNDEKKHLVAHLDELLLELYAERLA